MSSTAGPGSMRRFESRISVAEATARRRRRPPGPAPDRFVGDRRRLVDAARDALHARRSPSYAQGLGLAIHGVERDNEGWDLRPGAMANIWWGWLHHPRALLDRIREAYAAGAGAREPPPRRRVSGGDGRRVKDALAAGRLSEPRRLDPATPAFSSSAGLLRRISGRTRTGEPDPGPARSVRRPHLPPRRPRRHVPHRLERGRKRVRAVTGPSPGPARAHR